MTDQQTRTLSLGFIGGSLNSAVGYAHYSACIMDNAWTVAAGCFSRDRDGNRRTAHAFGVPADRTYDDWQTMLRQEKGRLDAVVVLTPTPTHFDIVSACIEADMPVICEKALATTAAEARAMLALREARNGFVAVTYNYSGYPMVRELRRLIRSGALGKIIHFHAEMPQESFIRVDAGGNKPAPQPWRLHDGPIPTISLDLAVHLHHMLHYLIGQKPVKVVADQGTFGWFSEVVDDVSCLCRYSGGVHGQIWFSKSALGHRNGMRLRIYGTKASAEWYQFTPEELLLNHADGRREILDRASIVEVANAQRYARFKAGHPAGFIEAFANLYKDIAQNLAQYQVSGGHVYDEVFGIELALEGLDLLEAIQRSATTESWQPVGG